MILDSSSIFIAGHTGMVGTALSRCLAEHGYCNQITATRRELDLLNQEQTHRFLKERQPDLVILAAARVGGIQANRSEPAQFLYENLAIQTNVIHGSYLAGVKKLIFIGSSCVYPRMCPQPMREEYLLSGPLEPTNEGYAIAKIAGIRLLQTYFEQYGLDGFSMMPCNLYGPNDSYDPVRSHVLSALVKRYVDAQQKGGDSVTLWGSGGARREFLHVTDLAQACVFLMNRIGRGDFINVGSGEDLSISELAQIVATEAEFTGQTLWDTTKPDGMPRKCLDIAKLNALGFRTSISLTEGIRMSIEEYRSTTGR